MQAMLSGHPNEQINLVNLEKVLQNIGAKDKFSTKELEEAVFEGKAYVDVQQIIQFL